MKLWLLDADVAIKFLEIDVFDKLAAQHELHVASSVIGEVTDPVAGLVAGQVTGQVTAEVIKTLNSISGEMTQSHLKLSSAQTALS